MFLHAGGLSKQNIILRLCYRFCSCFGEYEKGTLNNRFFIVWFLFVLFDTVCKSIKIIENIQELFNS